MAQSGRWVEETYRAVRQRAERNREERMRTATYMVGEDQDQKWLETVLAEARWEAQVMEHARRLARVGKDKSADWREVALDKLRDI
jgi:hypothetical protein